MTGYLLINMGDTKKGQKTKPKEKEKKRLCPQGIHSLTGETSEHI